MRTKKQTKGKWVTFGSGTDTDVYTESDEPGVTVIAWCTGGKCDDPDECEANAALMAEAGNVANESGKWPSDLIEENKKLRFALVQLLKIVEPLRLNMDKHESVQDSKWDTVRACLDNDIRTARAALEGNDEA